MLYESLESQPGVAHLNDLLRQQSENVYLKSKNRWILRFWRVFLDFLIFSIFDGFEVLWLWISTPWLDFLPGAASKSIWAGIFIIFKFFCSYGVYFSILQVRELGRYCELEPRKNVFWTSKIWVFLEFCGVFLDLLIFSILDSFEGIWLLKSTPWLDFLPGAASESIWAWISHVFRFSCSYGVHVLSVTWTQLP